MHYGSSMRSTSEYLGVWAQNTVGGLELGASIDVGLMSGGTALIASGALGGAGFEALTFGGRGKSGAEFVEGQLVGAGTGAVFGVAGKLAAPLIGKAAQAGGNATKAVAERLGAGELLEAGMLRASNVAANVETKLGNLVRTGSTNAEAAGVSTTVSSVAKPGSVVTRELAQGPGAGASVNTAAKSVVAETLPAKLVDRPMYGSAGASSLTRRQYVQANLVESHAINDNLGAGFSQFVQKERALTTNRGAAGLDAPYSARSVGDALETRYPGQVSSSTLPSALDKNVALADTRHPVSKIVFDNRGFPIFDDVAAFDTRIASKYSSVENSAAHMRAATRDLRESIARGEVSSSQFTAQQMRAIQGGKANIPNLTWHHHQDVGRMQLIPTKVHQQTGHVGGYEMWFR